MEIEVGRCFICDGYFSVNENGELVNCNGYFVLLSGGVLVNLGEIMG